MGATTEPGEPVLGKVTFKAIAHLVGARDSLVGDNEAIANPTTVKP